MNKKITLFISGLFFSFSLFAQSAAEALKEIETTNAKINVLAADFVQTKHLTLFDEPLITKGTLYLQKPDLFAWRSVSPVQYDMVIKGTSIAQWDAESRSTQKMSMASNPVFSTAIEQMKMWFYGDYSKLSNDYTITIVAQEPLAFKFVPHEDFFTAKMIKAMVITFNKDKSYLKKIVIEEKSGDSMEIEFSVVKINPKLDAKVWKVGS